MIQLYTCWLVNIYNFYIDTMSSLFYIFLGSVFRSFVFVCVSVWVIQLAHHWWVPSLLDRLVLRVETILFSVIPIFPTLHAFWEIISLIWCPNLILATDYKSLTGDSEWSLLGLNRKSTPLKIKGEAVGIWFQSRVCVGRFQRNPGSWFSIASCSNDAENMAAVNSVTRAHTVYQTAGIDSVTCDRVNEAFPQLGTNFPAICSDTRVVCNWERPV